MAIILHMTTRSQWQEALTSGIYRTDSLDSQGFIHCSKPEQVVAVANAHFPGRSDILLLCIEPENVTAPIQYENLQGCSNLFPHIYGPLNLDAVYKIVDFSSETDGTFRLPAGLQRL